MNTNGACSPGSATEESDTADDEGWEQVGPKNRSIITRTVSTNISANTIPLYNIDPTSKTLVRRCTNDVQMFCVCWDNISLLSAILF